MNKLDIYFYIQMAAFVFIGSLIGEFYRYSRRSISMTKFFANFFASCFLSYAVSFLFFYMTENKPLAFLIASVLAYQDEKYLNRISKKILVSLIKNLDILEEEKKKEEK